MNLVNVSEPLKSDVVPIEIALPSGKRLGIYLNGEDESLIKLIRGVLAC